VLDHGLDQLLLSARGVDDGSLGLDIGLCAAQAALCQLTS
jgi:hypothetical protein